MRERNRELARRRQRKAKRRKLRAKGLLGQSSESGKPNLKKRPEKSPAKEARQEPSPSAPTTAEAGGES